MAKTTQTPTQETIFEPEVIAAATVEDAVVVANFDELITREVAKLDTVAPAIEQLKAEYLPLKISGLDDKAGYEKVSKGLRFVVSRRTAVEDKRKELNADALKYQRAVNARAKEITESLAPIEAHLRIEKDKIDSEKERIEKEKAEAKQRMIILRQEDLYARNMFFSGSEYTWRSDYGMPSEVLNALNLEIMSNEAWAEYCAKIDQLNAREAELKAAEAAEQARKEAEIKAQQEAYEKQQEALRKQAEEMEQLKKQLAKAKTDARVATLKEYGLVVYDNGLGSAGMAYNGAIVVGRSFILDAEDAEWEQSLPLFKEKIDNLKQAELERQLALEKAKAEAAEQARQKAIADAEAERKQAEEAAAAKAEQDARIAEQAKRHAEAAAAERMAQMSDVEKVKLYATAISAVEIPSCKSAKYRAIVSGMNEKIQHVISPFL